MAYGQFTDYTPHPEIPGAYDFGTANGQRLTFGGPEADQLKARLDAANRATTVAGDNAAPGFDPNVQANAILASAQKQAGAPPPSLAALPPEQAAEVANGGMRPVISNGINTGLVSGPGGVYERTPGTAGISQAKRQKLATQGTATPTSASESVTGAHSLNNDYLEARSRETEDQQMALNKQRDAEVKAEEAGQAVAKSQFVAATAQQDTQQKLVNDIQAQVGQAQQTRDEALKDYTGTKVDPNRLFHGGVGMTRSLAAAIASGLGAYGASMTHTQNFAGQSIDAMISRDINAQQADLATKKDASDTALADLVRRGMSLDQAKGTLRTAQNAWAQQQLALARGSSNSDQINAHYDSLISGLQQQNDTEAEKYRQAAEGTATKNIQSQIMYPVAATGGGLRRIGGREALGIAGQVAENTGKQVSNVKGEAEAAKTEAEINKLRGAGAKPNAGAVDVKAGMHELNEFSQAFKAAGDPHIFLEHGPLASKASEELSSKADVLAPGLAAALSGQKRNPKLAETIAHTLKQGGPKARALIDQAREHLAARLQQEESKGSSAPTAADSAASAAEDALDEEALQ